MIDKLGSASGGSAPCRRISDHRPVTSPSEFTAADAATVAAAFELGEVVSFTGATGRGQLGFVFRLTTSRGSWAVKRLIEPQAEEDVREDVELVAAARAAGVPAPAMLTTGSGTVLLELAAAQPPPGQRPHGGLPGPVQGAQVRVSEWVELTDVDPDLDAAAVGAAVGALHRTEFRGTRESTRGTGNRWVQPVGMSCSRPSPTPALHSPTIWPGCETSS